MSFRKDTISSSAAYYDNQFRFDHAVQKGNQKIQQAKFLDTQESKQHQIDRHILTQFKNGIPPNSKFVLVAQVGKYIILAVILPPYYLVYQGPKYLLIQLEPVLELTSEKISQLLLFFSTLGVDLWAGLGKKMQKPKNLIKKNVESLKKAFERLQVKLTLRIKEVFRPFNILLHRIHNYTNTFKDKYSRALTWVRSFAITLPLKVKSALPNLKNALVNKWKAIIPEVIKPFKRLGEMSAKMSRKVAEVITPFAAFMGAQIIKALKPIKHVTKSATSQVKKMLNQVGVTTSHLVQISIVEPVKSLYQAAMKPLNAIKEVTKAVSNVVLERAQVATKALQNVATLALSPIQVASKAVFRFGKGAVGRVAEKLKVFGPAIKRVIKTLWDQGKRHGSKGYAALKSVVNKVIKTTAISLIWTFEKVKRAPFKILAFLKKVKTWIIHHYRKAVFAGRIVLAWTKILVRYSLQQLWS